MSAEQPRNLAASVRQRLFNIAKRDGEAFDLVLTRYALERFLYRLGHSQYHNQFLLKGAMLFAVWGGEPHRPTRDIDLLGYGSSDISLLEDVFRNICQELVEPDGVEFMPDSVRASEIRLDQEYQGVRVQFEARLENAVIKIQVDIGFGDAVTPAPEDIIYPVVLDFAAPRLRVYPVYTVVDEKFQAMVLLGIANTRMKDFYDIWFVSQKFSFEGRLLAQAIAATIARRNTSLPIATPLALSTTFSGDEVKQKQWKAFLRKNALPLDKLALDVVVKALYDFLMPAITNNDMDLKFHSVWPPGGPWVN